MKDVSEALEKLNTTNWSEVVQRENAKSGKGKHKLRTYRLFKDNFISECYVFTIMPKCHRSALAQFRCGTATLRIETGRYEGTPVEQRFCLFCKDKVEDEIHALLDCPLYNDVRVKLFNSLKAKYNGIYCFSKVELLKCILAAKDEDIVKKCAKACHEILTARRQFMYNDTTP